ncbi:MAG TPA: energy transducer TonB [Nitrospiria bacterium]|nr:energy transducer TonB [Nitrospiria bacterium]
MKRAFLISVWFHLLMIVLIVVPTLRLGRRLLRPSVYHVRLVEAPPQSAPPSMQPPAAPPRVQPPLKPAPPKPKAKAPAKPKAAPPLPHKAEAPPPLKSKTPPPPAPEPAPKPETPPPQPPSPPVQQGPASPSPSLMVQPKIDTPEFDCSLYCGVLQDKLEGQWTPPSVSAQGPVQAVVVFTINRDGTVSNVSLETSSGNFYFDQAALRAVMLAAPLPPLPRTLTSSTLRVHAPFTLQASP